MNGGFPAYDAALRILLALSQMLFHKADTFHQCAVFFRINIDHLAAFPFIRSRQHKNFIAFLDAKTQSAFQQLRIAKLTPWELKAESLELSDVPTSYYAQILKAARSPEARAVSKFKPTVEQAKRVVEMNIVEPTRL